ncbi:GOR1 [Candida margitis]|uniref:GOR1 n=1 Tax=Candida margitis TaxID=1775924 RepID=UPI0022262035|nr:GOR1 [Candida margitis]KAI5949661.1 GOR1 [Candida margitis]
MSTILRSLLARSRHSRAFRMMMIHELKPMMPEIRTQTRSYSDSNTSESTSQRRLESTKEFWRKAHIENSKESEKVLKLLRKTGAISILAVLASIAYAAIIEHSNKTEEEEQGIEYIPNLKEDIRYRKRDD